MAFVLKHTLKLTESQLDITLRAVRKLYPELSAAEKKDIRSTIADMLVGGVDVGKSNDRNRNAYQREYRARMKKAKVTKKAAKAPAKKKVAKKKATKKTTSDSK